MKSRPGDLFLERRMLLMSLFERIKDKYQIEKLSVIGKQCIAVICFERFCKKYNLNHPAITDFINHVWKVAQINPETFSEWEQGFANMPITGQGDPYPEDLKKAIPLNLLDDLNQFTIYIFEISAINWYTAYNPVGTTQMFLNAINIAQKHDITIQL